MNRLLGVVLAATTVIFVSLSQTRQQRMEHATTLIDSLLSSLYKGTYKELDKVVDVDSSVGAAGIADGNITDPYGTLRGCFVFMATTEEGEGEDRRHAIGVYKDGRIIWTSDRLSGSENYGVFPVSDEGILATKDLNRSGKVDIVVYYSDGTNPPSEYYLWIFEWNGKEGKCINEREKDGGTSITSPGAFDIADVNKDGVDEIRAHDSDSNVSTIYAWNGHLYVEKK